MQQRMVHWLSRRLAAPIKVSKLRVPVLPNELSKAAWTQGWIQFDGSRSRDFI